MVFILTMSIKATNKDSILFLKIDSPPVNAFSSNDLIEMCDVIEKHVTLNKNMSGPDHNASLDVDEFLKTIEVGNEIKKALGSDKKSFLKSEKVLNSILLRHLSIRRDIKVNSRLNIKDIKPVLTMNKKNSILPKDLFKVLGKKFKKSLKKGEILKYNHLKI